MNKLPDKFWVVTLPTPASVLEDICFETNLQGLKWQYAGGLEPKEIFGIYFDEARAFIAAKALLEHPQAYGE